MAIEKVCVVGYRGNMGRRYCTILDYLGIPYHGVEKEDEDWEPEKDVEGIIICTPTETHYEVLQNSCYGLPILCEKPLIKNIGHLEDFLQFGPETSMINQYRYFYTPSDELTLVENYHTGNDGLLWDCLNIIGMARSDIHLTKKSPIWNIELNGKRINRAKIDTAYIRNIEDWLTGDLVESKRYIIHAHKKVIEYEKRLKDCDWYTGEEVFLSSTGEVSKDPL